MRVGCEGVECNIIALSPSLPPSLPPSITPPPLSLSLSNRPDRLYRTTQLIPQAQKPLVLLYPMTTILSSPEEVS